MIVYRRAEKRCNVCKTLLAVKRFLFFKNVASYIPVDMEVAGMMGNEKFEMHICEECWSRMKEKTQMEIERYGT